MNVIRLGVCAPIEHILAAERAGFDYLEGNLSQIAVLPERSFRTQYALVHEAGIRCEVMAVSYTHLDVYKRQGLAWPSCRRGNRAWCSPPSSARVSQPPGRGWPSSWGWVTSRRAHRV